jgi:hypothetical protein
MTRRPLLCFGVGLVLGLSACGGGSTPTTPNTPAVTPAATVEASGNGSIEIHPSASAGFAAAIRFPISIRETGGGTADWTYARYSATRNGAEVERKEIGSTTLIANGISKITARQSSTYTLLFHVNVDTFDTLTLTLGFADLRDGRQFTTNVPGLSFSGIVVSPTPLSNPGQVARLDR